MKIRSLKIERFKRLENVEFNLDNVNILIGGNNSGKSTIIQAVHFAFTLFQSLTIGNKWPARTKKSSTISPNELIYVPSDDPYSLGFGGRLLEDEERAIVLSFTFTDGRQVSVSVRKGRITNILVEPDNIEFAKSLSKLNAPYTVFSPGLAGVSRTETFASDGVVLRALARGDANVVLRNILYRLNDMQRENFDSDLAQIFPKIRLDVQFDNKIDQYITVKAVESDKEIPLDLAGTGLLQAIQILAYINLFSPKLIILDEPDSHLHPNNQRLLCSLLTTISIERNVQVLLTTHSRHVLDTLNNDAKVLWVHDDTVAQAAPEDQVDLLLELGALDVKEKVASKQIKAVFLTEDRATFYLKKLLDNSGFDESMTEILSYNGVTSVNLLKPLVKQIQGLSKATIFVHRDRDFLNEDEIKIWKQQIIALGGEPFVTREIDIEGYFCSNDYMKAYFSKNKLNYEISEINDMISKDEIDAITASYVNGRIDIERKRGSIGGVDMGKLSADAARKVRATPLVYMKGKKRLAKLRQVLTENYSIRYDINALTDAPRDPDLAKAAEKVMRKRIK